MRTFATLLVAIGAAGAPAIARGAPTEAQECAHAAEQIQALRKQGKLVEATAQLPRCLRASCPSFVRDDCALAQTEIAASMPTVVVSARTDDGRDLAAVRVSVDGAGFLPRLDGLAQPINPGEHDIRFETDGALPVTQHIFIREGDKRRVISVAFPMTTDGSGSSHPQPNRAVSPGVWVFGAIGVAALGGFAYLGATGLSEVHALRDGCGRDGSCAPSDVSAARTKLWIADVLGGIGLGSIGIATWLFFRASPQLGVQSQVGVRAAPGGGVAEFRATF